MNTLADNTEPNRQRINPQDEVDEDRSLEPRLLREISVETIDAIHDTLRELNLLFPSYRDNQLFVFWLGKLSQNGIDVHNFDSRVSFETEEKK